MIKLIVNADDLGIDPDINRGIEISHQQFADNIEKQDAVARRIEVIGEAVKRLPESLCQQHPEVPWREIAGARDVLIHEYFRIDVRLAWEMVQKDIPDLAARIRKILRELED